MTVKNWTFAYNTAPENQTTAQLQAASLHKQRKDFLVAGGWTVTRSCDSTQVVNGDCLTDVATDFVWSAAGARTWMELKSPEGFYAGLDGNYLGDQSRCWVTIQLNSASVYKAEIYFHNVVPSGTANVSTCPSSTNKIGYTDQQMLRDTFDNRAAFNFARVDEGQWIEFIGYTGAGIAPWALLAPPFTEVNYNPDTNKDFPFAFMVYCNYRDSSRGALEIYTSYGSILVIPSNGAANGKANWGQTGVAETDLAVATLSWRNSQNYGFAIGQTFSSTARDAFSFSFPDGPLIALNRSASPYVIGKIADLLISGAPYNQGTPNSPTAPTTVAIGDMLLPTNTGLTWL